MRLNSTPPAPGTDRPPLIGSLADIAPDLASLANSFAYGQVYARPQLSLPQRQLSTVAMLAAERAETN